MSMKIVYVYETSNTNIAFYQKWSVFSQNLFIKYDRMAYTAFWPGKKTLVFLMCFLMYTQPWFSFKIFNIQKIFRTPYCLPDLPASAWAGRARLLASGQPPTGCCYFQDQCPLQYQRGRFQHISRYLNKIKNYFWVGLSHPWFTLTYT